MTKQKFFDRFIAVFATGVPEKQIQRHVYDTKKYNNFLWHLFSWELLPQNVYLTGDAARKAYNAADKKGAEYIEWFEDDCTKKVTLEQKTAEQLEEYIEVYVVSKDFKWVYMKTHEGDCCGPYFMKI